MRLFKLRKDSMLKASKSLMDHFKGQAKTAQAPSPYNASNNKYVLPLDREVCYQILLHVL